MDPTLCTEKGITSFTGPLGDVVKGETIFFSSYRLPDSF